MITPSTPVPLYSTTPGGAVDLSGPGVGAATAVAGGSGITSYQHVQTTPATVWSVQHNLGRRPAAIALFSDDFATEWTDYAVSHVDENLLHITADIAISGKGLFE